MACQPNFNRPANILCYYSTIFWFLKEFINAVSFTYSDKQNYSDYLLYLSYSIHNPSTVSPQVQ